MRFSPSSAWPAWIALASVAASSVGAQPIGPRQAANEPLVTFDIPAQPLDIALRRYFELTGVQLLYDSILTDRRLSTAVRGRLSPREALQRLLGGTGLSVRYSRANAAIIVPAMSATAGQSLVPLGRVVVRARIVTPRPPSPVDRLAYYGQLETEVQAHLRDDDRAARLSFGVRASIRIGNDGLVSQASLVRGSGDTRTDRTLVQALTGLRVSVPPDGLAQPLVLELKGRPRSRRD